MPIFKCIGSSICPQEVGQEAESIPVLKMRILGLGEVKQISKIRRIPRNRFLNLQLTSSSQSCFVMLWFSWASFHHLNWLRRTKISNGEGESHRVTEPILTVEKTREKKFGKEVESTLPFSPRERKSDFFFFFFGTCYKERMLSRKLIPRLVIGKGHPIPPGQLPLTVETREELTAKIPQKIQPG